jgi:hypothetical protein
MITEALKAMLLIAARNGVSRPLRLRMEFENPVDNFDAGFSAVRNNSNETVQVDAHKPSVRRVDPDPASADDAILLALFYCDCRRTGPELVDDVQERWPNKWSNGHIATTASVMAKNGQLKNHQRDPGDGKGKGYGRAEWESGVGESQ